MAVRKLPTLDGSNDVFEKFLPDRLLTPGLAATIEGAVTIYSLQTRQTYLMGEFDRRLKGGSTTTIVMAGDSHFYGQDAFSADRIPAPTTALPDGTFHSVDRSPITIPSMLQARLRAVYGGGITVLNQGRSGDTAQIGYNRWSNIPGQHLTIIGYGANDADAEFVDAAYRGNVTEYVQWLERWVIRCLRQDSAVVFSEIPKQRDWVGSTVREAYRVAMRELGKKYGIPVIPTATLTANYTGTIHSDAAHFNSTGYTIVGTRMAAFFIASQPNDLLQVNPGSVLLTRPVADHCKVVGLNVMSGAGSGVATEGQSGGGILQAPTTDTEGNVYYSFETTAADTYVIPLVYLNNTGAGIGGWYAELDFGIDQPDNTHDLLVDAATTAPGPGSSTFRNSTSVVETYNNYLRSGVGKGSNTPFSIRIAAPGVHSLRLMAKRNSSALSINVMGLEFEGRATMYLQKALAPA